MRRVERMFHFGGDHSAMCSWVAKVPMFVHGALGFVDGFILKGETPMLMGRPIMKELGIVFDFCNDLMAIGSSEWFACTLGRHGEYLLSLTDDFDAALLDLEPSFDLDLKTDVPLPETVETDTVLLNDYMKLEGVFQVSDQSEAPARGIRNVTLKTWKALDASLASQSNLLHAMVTQEIHAPPRPRVVWEIYAGKARVSQICESLGCVTEVFGYETGWDFDVPSHRRHLLQRMVDEEPDEIYVAPRCGLWSTMQSINATSAEKKIKLQDERQIHHDSHLLFCRRIYKHQHRHGRHAHLEQPQTAVSWQTVALKDLPGYRATFDQCRYGAVCEDADGAWKPVRKSTTLATTKRAMAQAMNLRCEGGHQHCKLEGSMSCSRSRTQFMENYQPAMAGVIAAALAAEELPDDWSMVLAVDDEQPRERKGQLVQLSSEKHGDALRVVQKLHRNLGHPSAEALTELLEARGASEVVLRCARQYQCTACLTYKKPKQVAPASSKAVFTFNQQIQADVMWIKSGSNKFPVMSMIDEGTRFQAASLLLNERSEQFIKVLERSWIANFGPPVRLVTNEGRGWLSEEFEKWSDAKAIHHLVAPGEAHQQLSLVERRHALLRKAIELYCNDLQLEGANAVKEALVYVVPQLNASPTVSGYSPSQWVLGQQPHFPGDLLNDHVTPLHLGGSVSFEDELLKRTTAKLALVQADADNKLRRALLRRYAGTNTPLEVGQKCYFWRDAKASDLVKIRWKGPAVVVMKEVDDENKPRVYWLAHKTQLLRCAPHHVRADIGANRETVISSLKTADECVRQLRSRGVTRYVDLHAANKRRMIDDLDSGDEILDDGEETDQLPEDSERHV